MLVSLARLVESFGWHVQIPMTGGQIAANEDVIRADPAELFGF